MRRTAHTRGALQGLVGCGAGRWMLRGGGRAPGQSCGGGSDDAATRDYGEQGGLAAHLSCGMRAIEVQGPF